MGAGNVAWHMAHHFSRAGLKVESFQRSKRDFGLHPKLPVHTEWESFLDFDAQVLILAVRDDAIDVVASKIPKNYQGVVAHTSGAKPMSILGGIFQNGVFYPLQTLTKGRKLPKDKIPICLEGNTQETFKKLKLLAEQVGFPNRKIKSPERAKLHLAAVFTNNFSNKLWQMAQDYAAKQGVEANTLSPLLEETYAKFRELGGIAAQTGPASRGDTKTISEHLAELENENLSDYIAVYKALTEAIKQDFNE